MNPIEQQIARIEASGAIADPNTWISSYVVTKKSGKSYRYYRLMTHIRDKEGKLKKKMAKYLGTEGSFAYKQTVQAIKRRNRIQALQRQLKRLVEQPPLPMPRKRSTFNPPPTTSENPLLLQLQQLFHQLTERLERLEREMSALSGDGT